MLSVFLSMLETEEERDIFKDFYNANYDRLVYIAYKNLHNKHDAEEAVDEAFMRIIDKPGKFFSLDERKRIAYMDVVVRNISVTMFKKKTKETFIDDEFVYDEPEAGINIEREVIGKCSEGELREFIKTLPDSLRETLTLKMSCDLSYQEIAEHLDITEATTRKRVSLAYQRIRDYLEKQK